MPDLFSFAPTNFSISKDFDFKVFRGIYSTKITMTCQPNLVNTSQLPHTYDTLNELLPTIFRSKCFNDLDYPFIVEVRKTEIAHLFEHILLEYICQYRLAYGDRKVSVSGVTDWNWKRDPFGMFHITVMVGREEARTFEPAFKSSLKLLELLVKRGLHKEKQTVL